MSDESISQPAPTTALAARLAAASAASSRPRPVGEDRHGDEGVEADYAIDSPVPDWCNVGLMLRVVVAVNLLFIFIASIEAGSVAEWFDQWLGLSIRVEPVLIASLFFGCLLRRATWRWSAPVQWTMALLLPAALTLGTGQLMRDRLELSPLAPLRDALFTTLIAAGVLYWARLRARAYSPALAEARLQALQSRIRPHFLFNSLNAALSLIRSDPRRAETVLEDLADLFRVLMRDGRERVPLRDEIAVCRQYLAIESLRLGDRLKVEWRIDPATDIALVPSLLLQPLIENAVHHGIEPSAAAGTIAVVIGRSGRYVDISITNPWLGDATAAATRGNGMGLDNVRQRLALVHDLEASIDSAVRGDHYVVRMRLPAERRRAPRIGKPS